MFLILYNTLAKIAKYFFRTYISSVIYFAYNMIPLFMFFHSEYSLIAPSANLAEEILYAKVQCPGDCQAPLC